MSEVLGEAEAFGVQCAFVAGSTLLNSLRRETRQWQQDEPASITMVAPCPKVNTCLAGDQHIFTYYTCNPALYEDREMCDFRVPTHFIEEMTFMRRRAADMGTFRDAILLPDPARLKVKARTRYIISEDERVIRYHNSLSAYGPKGSVFMLTEFLRLAGAGNTLKEDTRRISQIASIVMTNIRENSQ